MTEKPTYDKLERKIYMTQEKVESDTLKQFVLTDYLPLSSSLLSGWPIYFSIMRQRAITDVAG